MTVEELYLAYGPLIYRRCLRLLGNDHEAEEALQEIFLALLSALARGRRIDALRNYLFRSSTNHCLNRLRDGRKFRNHVGPEYLPADRRPDPEQEASHREGALAVLLALDERNRLVAWLHFVEGHTQEEVAELAGLSRRTVGKYLRRMRRTTAVAPVVSGG